MFQVKGVDRAEVAWKVLQTQIFKAKEGGREKRERERRRERERGAVSRRRPCQFSAVPGLKSARRKQDVKDFQTPTRPLTERYI